MYQECREACGGQGLKTENRVGVFKAEFDVQSTFEGDNNVLMQQVIVVFSHASVFIKGASCGCNNLTLFR